MGDEQANPLLPNGIASAEPRMPPSPHQGLDRSDEFSGLVVRIFIIQHDCGHGAFFRSRAANEWLGRFCSLITMTPYANWRHQHAIHHAVWNNLDRRSAGADIYSTCPTVAEYRTHSALGRWWRRVVRHPLIAHLLLPPLIFVLLPALLRGFIDQIHGPVAP
jgi:fatty acid desaturase